MSQRKFVSALLIGLVILLSMPFGSHPVLIPKVRGVTTNITLYAYFFGWNDSKSSGTNPTITVTQGDTISFTLIEGDTSTHRLLLDLDNSSITTDCPNSGPDKCSGDITPTQGSSIPSFTVTSAPGTYFYYCTYHSPAYMVGKFVVLPSATPDFKLVSNPTSLTINQGSSGSSTINVTATNGFTGTVSLTTSVSSGGPIVSLSPQSVTLSNTVTSATAMLTVVTTSNSGAYSTPVSLGSYNITLTGTVGSLSHSKVIPLTVVQMVDGGTPVSPIFIGGIIAAIVIVALAVYALRRRPKK